MTDSRNLYSTALCTCKMKVDTHKSVGVYILMYTERGGKKWVRKV
jgi:hypothetical protein